MIVHEIHDLSNSAVVELLKRGLEHIQDHKYVKNYHPDYKDEYANIFYLLGCGRYQRGKYFVVEENNKFVCSAGWNEYSLNNNTALLLTRMYVDQQYRAQYITGKNLLPVMLQESKEYLNRWITVNDHNKTIYDWFDRARNGKRTALFNNWPEIYKKFRPLGQRTVYYTNQWVVEYCD